MSTVREAGDWHPCYHRRMVVEPGRTPTGLSFIPPPAPGERPTEYADRIGQYHVASKSETHRKQHGLNLTPVGAADFMPWFTHSDRVERHSNATKSCRRMSFSTALGSMARGKIAKLRW